MIDEKGKSAAQVAGSIITYLRRYALAAALGIYADEDTDGHLAQPRPQAQPEPQPPTPTPDGIILEHFANDMKAAKNAAASDYGLDLANPVHRAEFAKRLTEKS
jgi:hypothetical protein